MSYKNRGPNASGGSRSRLRVDIDSPVAIGPIASQVGLLRAYLAKRKYLDPHEVHMAEDFLRQAVRRPLTSKQVTWLEEHAKMVGAVYEEPLPATVPVGAVSVQPWGALPSKPPASRAS